MVKSPFFAGKLSIFGLFSSSPLGVPDGFMVLGRAKAAAAEAALRVRLRVRQLGGSLA